MVQGWLAFWKEKASDLKVQTLALYFAYRDPRVPWYAKVWIAIVVAYAFSPIDLIPDFIPVLGYLDDFVLIPMGVWLALKMIPAHVMAESREKAREAARGDAPEFKFMTWIVIGLWVAGIGLIGYFVFNAVGVK
jgi:uncharacterized membrane protein YkvA (DUF1232 family)